jgi:predicted nucleic acid-binding protein
MEEREIVAPCHLAFEAASVIRNRIHRAEVTAEVGQLAFEALLAQNIELIHPMGLVERAWEMAEQFNRPTVYDAYYLALGEELGCELWTADRRLHRAVHDVLPWVKLLHSNSSIP